jgi:protein-S-isoprenylcysteine O-methyltransferase
VIAGEFLRKLAMWTAQHNFTHIVQDRRRDEHVLVTHGIYGYSRHPSYVGWFLFSVGTQVGRTRSVPVLERGLIHP